MHNMAEFVYSLPLADPAICCVCETSREPLPPNFVVVIVVLVAAVSNIKLVKNHRLSRQYSVLNEYVKSLELLKNCFVFLCDAPYSVLCLRNEKHFFVCFILK